MSISYGGDFITDSDGGKLRPSSSVMRNRIINGDCRIDQRNAGAAVTASGSFPVDRFIASNSTDGAISAQQDSSAPAGFNYSLKFTTTTADASLASTQAAAVIQYIEGYNVADLGWGTANAKTVTLSFWVKSSLTGTFGGCLRNSDASRSYPFSYVISSADTWEQKSITVAGDTTGTWLTTNGRGIALIFSMGAGADRVSTAGAWASANYQGVTGQVQVIGTLSASWQATGVQLEVGSSATGYEYVNYQTSLANCQRYYAKMTAGGGAYTAFGSGRGGGGTAAFCFIKYPVTMRSSPTIAISNVGVNTPSQVTATGINSTYAGIDSAGFEVATGSTTISSGAAVILNANANSAGYIELTSEL